MTRATTKADSSLPQNGTEGHLFDNWNNPLETEIRSRTVGLSKSLFTRSLSGFGTQKVRLRQVDRSSSFSGQSHYRLTQPQPPFLCCR